MKRHLMTSGVAMSILIVSAGLSLCAGQPPQTPQVEHEHISARHPCSVMSGTTSPIAEKYAALGAAQGFLGNATSPDAHTPDGIGCFRHFEGGSIYWSPGTGAHEVHGAIRDKWSSLGWEKSVLGYPTTDETKTPDGVGSYNHFQGGSIYWTAWTEAHEVHGAIRDKWSSLGWEKSVLGYPMTDETNTPDGVGRYNQFRSGSIYWSPQTGAHEVHGWFRDKWASMGWEKSCLLYPTSDQYLTANKWKQDFQGGTVTQGKAYACGCLDWKQPPPGIVTGLKHSTNQSTKQLIWDGSPYDPALGGVTPPAMFTRQTGGDLGGSEGQGFYWFETNGDGFEFPEDAKTWHNFLVNLPPGLVLGLKHSSNQPGKALMWLPSNASNNWTPSPFNPAIDDAGLLLPSLMRMNGGDLDGGSGEGFYWYEVNDWGQNDTCTTSLLGGLIFGLKHSSNQSLKKLRWLGVEYDVADWGGPRPPGFARCNGGDLHGGEGEGFYWFETLGSGPTQQTKLASCETEPWVPDFMPKILSFTQTILNADKARLYWGVHSGPKCSIKIVGGTNFDDLGAAGSKDVWRGCPSGGGNYEYKLIVQCGKNQDSRTIAVPNGCAGYVTPPTGKIFFFKATQSSAVTPCFVFPVTADSEDQAKQLAQAYAANATVTEITEAEFYNPNICGGS